MSVNEILVVRREDNDCTFPIHINWGFGDLLRSTGLPQRPTGPALARTFRISDWPWADSGFHAAPTSVGCPLLRPCSAQQAPSALVRCGGSWRA